MKPIDYQQYFELAEASDTDTFLHRLLKFSAGIGFPLANATAMTLDPDGRCSRWRSIRNAPTAWANQVHNKADEARDPCLIIARSTIRPFAYDQALYLRHSAGDLWEEQAPHGYRTGISAVLHLSHGRHFYIGMDRDEPLPANQDVLMRMLADVQLMATFVQDTAFRLLVDQQATPSAEALSAREREVLVWASNGKTAWETGRLLSISEHTVNKHLSAATRRLGCSSKAQAVARAFKQGLL